jgi:hypothetical protein
MEINLKESFSRVHKRVDTIEDQQNNRGCSALRVQELRVRNVEDALKANSSHKAWIVTTVIGIIIVALVRSIIK